MAVEAARGRPELLRFEVALARVFADRAHAASRHDRMLRLFAERIIDLANLWTALVLANHAADVDAGSLFVEGGRLVLPSDLAFALGAAHREPLTQRLLPRVAGTPLAPALDATEGHDAEDAALDAMVRNFACWPAAIRPASRRSSPSCCSSARSCARCCASSGACRSAFRR